MLYRIFNKKTHKYLSDSELKTLSISSDNALIEPWIFTNENSVSFYVNDIIQDLKSDWVGVLKIIDGRIVIEDNNKNQVEVITWENYEVVGNMNQHPDRLPKTSSIPTLMELMGRGEEI